MVHSFFKKILIWLVRISAVAPSLLSVAARGISWLQHVGCRSLTGGWTQALCTGSGESRPLAHQGSPYTHCILYTVVLLACYNSFQKLTPYWHILGCLWLLKVSVSSSANQLTPRRMSYFHVGHGEEILKGSKTCFWTTAWVEANRKITFKKITFWAS